MFKLSSTFIGLTAGATMGATLATAQELPEIDLCPVPTEFLHIECNKETKEPIAVFNQCSTSTLTIGVMDLGTGSFATMTQMAAEYFESEATAEILKEELQAAEDGFEFDPSTLEAIKQANKAMQNNSCSKLSF